MGKTNKIGGSDFASPAVDLRVPLPSTSPTSNSSLFDWSYASSQYVNTSTPITQSNPRTPINFNWKYFVAGVALIAVSGLGIGAGGTALTDCTHSSDCVGTGTTAMIGRSAAGIASIVCFYKTFKSN